MSVRASASPPSSCSGAMYWRVPRIVPSAVSSARACCVGRLVNETPDRAAAGATAFARPKSRSFTPDFVQRADVWVRELGDRLRLALEALADLRARGEMGGQHLDGDRPIQARVA